MQKSTVIISGKELQDFLAEIGNWIQENQLYAGHGLSSELGHLDAAFRTLLLNDRNYYSLNRPMSFDTDLCSIDCFFPPPNL